MMMTFTDAYITKKDIMDAATEIGYDMNSKELDFYIHEGGALVCSFEKAVSGTESQLFTYYAHELRRLFPNALIEIKGINSKEYQRI